MKIFSVAKNNVLDVHKSCIKFVAERGENKINVALNCQRIIPTLMSAAI